MAMLRRRHSPVSGCLSCATGPGRGTRRAAAELVPRRSPVRPRPRHHRRGCPGGRRSGTSGASGRWSGADGAADAATRGERFCDAEVVLRTSSPRLHGAAQLLLQHLYLDAVLLRDKPLLVQFRFEQAHRFLRPPQLATLLAHLTVDRVELLQLHVDALRWGGLLGLRRLLNGLYLVGGPGLIRGATSSSSCTGRGRLNLEFLQLTKPSTEARDLLGLLLALPSKFADDPAQVHDVFGAHHAGGLLGVTDRGTTIGCVLHARHCGPCQASWVRSPLPRHQAGARRYSTGQSHDIVWHR
mmetsp:Transcript_84104/g.234564  ORF Transcript_84104/g.234564 Transcript_84104/m.234564 type:complete len:298 (+) Transcript_84104:186-1079(+)